MALLVALSDALGSSRRPTAAPRFVGRDAHPLVGQQHRLELDFGRETGTWMPPRWAGDDRALFSLDLRWLSDGTAEIVEPAIPGRGLALGLGASWRVTTASWQVIDGTTLRVSLCHDGLAVERIVLDAGTVDLSLPLFGGGVLSKKEGLMSIIAYRLLVRKERRLVGVFYAKPLAGASESPPDR